MAAEGSFADFRDAAQVVLEDLRGRVGLDSWLVARRTGGDSVVLAAAEDDPFGLAPGASRPFEDTYCVRVLDGRAPAAAADLDEHPALVQARAANGVPARSVLVLPLPGPDGEVLGTLCATGRAPYPGGQPELDAALPTVRVQASLLGALLARELRLAEAARRAERAEAAATTDVLTGVGNRRAWDEALAHEEARATRYAGDVALVVVDLDGLKAVNDEQGHSAGDELLRVAARVLRARARESDLVARLGGDEFGLLLPGTDGAGAAALAAQLRGLLAAEGVGASVGAAARPTSGSLADAWRAADASMYAEKVARRSRALAERAGERPRPAGRAGSAAQAAQAAAAPAPPASVDALLRLARDQLGMEVAFLNRFDGEQRTFRNVQARVPLPFAAGRTEPRQGTYCQMIVDGALGEVTPDTSRDDRVRDLPITAELGIGAYVGVPVHLRDGRLYGTLCAFSREPDPTLRDRDAQVLRSLRQVVADVAEREDGEEARRHEVLARLDALQAEGGPQMVFQPVLELDGLGQVGVEALSRFPTGSPDAWFAAAAAAGAGPDLELRAVARALEALEHVEGFLALNVSPATVATPELARRLAPYPPGRIVLEVTEHEAIADYDGLNAALRPLRGAGVRLAVDDAGAGFASMRHVLALAPDVLKLDTSLVRGIDAHPGRQALATALATFAAATGATVVGEGIETQAELDLLRDLGIAHGQGFHLARPAPLPVPAG
ncbi:sensor domain-containing phosphodiesterase [Vallicoccus soli]|uniref:sensor domain-containing phosphodiesterase n=1 Tax=Vallicoccus soli TaxID=2339232 RepID=UPI0014033E0B|nr:EAL domain-containing protein [Vallicoccus soli]